MSTARAAVILNKTINARLIFLLYQVLQIALTPALVLYLLYRGFRNRAYFTNLGERFGFLPPTLQSTGLGSLWFHAVSVGEILSSVELIRRIRSERPDLDIFVSTTTLAGRAMAAQRLSGLAKGVFYTPFDYCGIVRRVLRRLRPACVIVMETEIWPNLYRESKRAGASLLIVNGRISDRALPRYRAWRWFFTPTLAQPDAIYTQSQRDVDRYLQAGAPPGRVSFLGNLKYDFQPPKQLPSDLAGFLTRSRDRQGAVIWIAASTMPPAVPGDPDEDDAVIAAFQHLARPNQLLILAPRRPDRFDSAASKLAAANVRFTRRSNLGPIELPGVLLLDTIGELASVFAHADAVFMGGTLASRGGHNILEPAYFAKPIVAGPHMENFAEIATEFSGAMVRIAAAADLAPAIASLLDNPGDLGSRAQQIAQSKRGVVDQAAARILEAAAEGVPNPPRTLLARAALTPLTCLWALGHRINFARQHSAQKKLPHRVISVGGLTMGGTGKTPIVAHLVEKLDGAAILTRGYRRQSRTPLIVRRGANAPIEQTGDEAQLFIRRRIADVGIGPDRYFLGRQLKAPLYLLDDGFQHVCLHRDVDLVLIDATNPWGGGLFPLGRRREPLTALARATAVILTRVPDLAATTGLERAIRQYTQAPIFRSQMVPEPIPVRNVAAFCGIGSPASFWQTLETLGLLVLSKAEFPDHHRYAPSDLEALARTPGAQALVTTEKDMMNLPPGLTLPLPIHPVRIQVKIQNELEFLKIVKGEH